MIDWFKGWWETILIWAFDRELWNDLAKPFNPDDFEEVDRPT